MKISGWDIDVSPEVWKYIENEHLVKSILPKIENTFLSFELTPYDRVKVVIFGQDPYPNKKDAMGLAFSVNRCDKIPKSLQNIFKELKSDLNIDRTNGDLSDWAKQGVLLLNKTLIVEEGNSNSHKDYDFDNLFVKVMDKLSEKKEIVYILLGSESQKLEKYINKNNLILKVVHPSPLSSYRGFFGSSIFSKTNKYLKEKGKEEIKW